MDRQALVRQARSAKEWDQTLDALDAFDLIETSADHVRRALQVQRVLAAKHQRGRKVPDLRIAAAAEANGLNVLHYDADFDRVATVTGQPVEWVVRAGSVDWFPDLVSCHAAEAR